MRFFGRTPFLAVVAVLIAVGGIAQESVPVSLHPNSRIWLSDTAAIVMQNDLPQTVDTIRQVVESVDGHLVLYAPPGILIAQIPDEGMNAVALTPNVRLITKSPFDPATLGITDHNALLAVNYFNWVVSGHADAQLDHQLDASTEAPSLESDVTLPPSSAAQATALSAGDHPFLGTSVLVNLAFLNGGTSTWNDTDEGAAYNNTAAALSWWNSRVLQQFGTARPSGLPFFTIRKYDFSIGMTPGDAFKTVQWVNAAMSVACGGTCTWFDANAATHDAETNVRNWNIATREAAGYSDSFTGFMVHGTVSLGDKPVGGFAEIIGGAFWAVGNNVLTDPSVPAHETGHIYWACDEYDNADLNVHPSCTVCGGPRNALNANADSLDHTGCVIPDHRHICIMKYPQGDSFALIANDLDSEYRKVCPYTRVQIGWWADNNCYSDVNWDQPSFGTTHWEGTYWSDSHAPRMPLVHWSGGPQLTRDDGGGNVLDFNFIANPVTGICLTGSASGARTTDFSARWRRVVNFEYGNYEFHGTGDDSVQIYVDGFELKPSAIPGTFEKLQIFPGNRTVQVDFFQTGGNANVHVDWVKIANPTCSFLAGSLKSFQKTDYCPGESNVPHLQVFVTGGTAPYRVTVQRNSDQPVTYAVAAGVADIYPQGVMGDSMYTLTAVFDNNGCQGQIDAQANSVKVNIDSNTPRIVGKLYATQPNNACSVSTNWDEAVDCNGGPKSYTLLRNHYTAGGSLISDTLFACEQWTSFQDNDVHSGTDYTYFLTATLGTNCATGTKRNYLPTPYTVNCSASASAIATSSISASFGDHPTLTAHLTGNGSPLPNRAVEFDLNGTAAGSGTTDANGNASTTTTITLNAGTYPAGLRVRFSGDDAWYAATATGDVTVQPTCIPAAITSQPGGQTINLGGTATVSIATSGTAPVAVQWYTTAGAFVGGGNSLTVSPSWTTTYYAMVSNGCHSVQSSPVMIMVRQPATITWSAPAAITYGTALSAMQLSATPNVPGTFTYTPPAGTVLAAGTRSLSLSFTPVDTANYLVTTATQSIVVQKADPTGSWTPPAPITYGTPLSATQLNGTADIPGTIVYDPPAGTILTAGTHTLTATFTPNDSANYNTKSGAVSITVLKATPAITWSAPANITYGTALGATQLNATATAPGTFTYAPAAGTIPGAGDRSLTVTFVPTDSANYNQASATVNLHVVRAAQTINWATPGPVPTGTAISSAQLNATVSVVGPAAAGAISYDVAVGTVMSAGDHTLTASAAATDNYDAAQRSVVLHACDFPAITSQPQGAVVGLGGSAHLTLQATNYSTITWYKSDGTLVSTGMPYVAVSTTTSYYAIVSNACAGVQSATITITVCSPPSITSQPASYNIVLGQTAELSIGVAPLTAEQIAGGGPLYIQWFKANGDVSVGGGNDLVVYPTATTTYYAKVSNGCGLVRSANATIGVAIPACLIPSINSQSANPSITSGNSSTLSIDASSTTQLHYQWYTGYDAGTAVGTDSPSFDTGILSLDGNAQFSMIFRYWVVVSNNCGVVRSDDFLVTVSPGGLIDNGD